MKRKVMIFLLVAIAQSAIGSDDVTADEKSAAFDQAEIFGRCAGMLAFAGVIAERAGQKLTSMDAQQKASGWRTATMGALIVAGWEGERITTTADSMYERALSSWMAKLESGSETAPEELSNEMDFCLQHDASEREYKKKYNRMINQ